MLKPFSIYWGLTMALFGMSFSGLFGQEIPADSLNQKGDPEIPAIENSLLWEITGKDLVKPSYLFGTIHLIPKDSFFVTEVMEERMAEADRLVLEVELDGGAMLSSMFGVMMPPGKSLETILGPDDYAYLKGFIEDSLPEGNGVAINMMMVDMMKPIFTSEQIASAFCSADESSEQVSYEMWLSEKFKEGERPISGLETASEQLSFLDKIPLEEQAHQLMETIKNPYGMCGQYGELIALYRRQDLNALMTMTSSDPGMGDHLDVLLDQRNKNWIPKIEKMLEEETLFVAVGAGHLAGKNGVVNLLKEAGYTVKPLK